MEAVSNMKGPNLVRAFPLPRGPKKLMPMNLGYPQQRNSGEDDVKTVSQAAQVTDGAFWNHVGIRDEQCPTALLWAVADSLCPQKDNHQESNMARLVHRLPLSNQLNIYNPGTHHYDRETKEPGMKAV
jgi:hypothetical protein